MYMVGSQLDTLDAVAHRIVTALTGAKGVTDLQFKPESATPTLSLQIDPRALAASGLKTADVLEALQDNYAGATLGQTFEGIRSINVVMLLPEKERNRIESLSALLISSPLGPLPLSQGMTENILRLQLPLP